MSQADSLQQTSGGRIDRRSFLGNCAAGAVAAAMTPVGQLAAADVQPTHTAPLAMWALTGMLKSADVCRQLDAYAAVGWGAVLYPRWGAEIEYLSPTWFERIRFIVDQAAARSMEIWLYDEFCWPSGHAKGLVTQDHPELAAQVLCVKPDGSSRIETMPGWANMVQPEATQRFLAVTHQRYAAALGGHLGKTVRAIFTDEPSLPAQHRPRAAGDTAWRLMWSETLNQALGGDFVPRLAAAGSLVAKSPLWRDYWAAFARTYHDAWTRPIADWCQAHGIALAGHLLGEDAFGEHVAHYGSLRRQLDAFQIPGIDEIGTRCDVEQCEALTLATIAAYPGRERMCEVFALGPCHMRMDTMRRMIDLLGACGVDRYVMAISPFDLRGGVFKREYLGVYSPQQPWFRDYARAWTDYLAEVAWRARRAQPLVVPWPTDEELWEVAGPAPRQSAALQQITRRFRDAARAALRGRVAAAPAAPVRSRRRLAAAWTFAPAEGNSLRIDGPDLDIVDVPPTAELSVQMQLVRGVRINGQPVDLAAAPADTRFDLSYGRVSVAQMLHAGRNRIEVETQEPKPLPFLPALILWGDFAVDAQRRIVRPAGAIELGDWRAEGYPALCGVGRYRTNVAWTLPPAFLSLDTGKYPARVVVNGRECGRRPWGPWEYDLRPATRPGANEIVVEVASTLGHLFVPGSAPPIGLLDAWVSG